MYVYGGWLKDRNGAVLLKTVQKESGLNIHCMRTYYLNSLKKIL